MVVQDLGQSEQQRGPECMHNTDQVMRESMAVRYAVQDLLTVLSQVSNNPFRLTGDYLK